MKRFDFCRKWLTGVGLYLAVFGLILAVFPQSGLMNFAFNSRIDPEFWPNGPLPENARNFQAWIYGVLGATVLGWGLMLAFVAHYPFKAREKWAWNCLAAAVGFWFVVDTAISAGYGVGFNVFFNILILLAVALPLAVTRGQFRGA